MAPLTFRRFGLCSGLAGVLLTPAASPAQPPARTELRPASAFAGIADPHARSLALYGEMFKVISSPRCMNCHPAERRPEQGEDHHPHLPPVVAGPDGHGPPGLPCAACHHAANTPVLGARLKSVPGNPKWALAPPEMAWEGRTPGQICEQIKAPARNGGKDLQALYRHFAFDELVSWGWAPGAGRVPAPGTQAAFGQLVRAWIDTGAACPS